jgi:tetratricopeptide (TPR) repeat protein
MVMGLLLVLGLRGRNESQRAAKLSNITSARDHIQEALNGKIVELPLANGGVTNVSVTTLVLGLELLLSEFDRSYPESKLSTSETFEVNTCKGTLANARLQFREALNFLPQDFSGAAGGDSQGVRVAQIRGDAFYGLKQWGEALPRYEQVLSNHPNELLVRERAAICLQSLGRTNEAISAFRELALARVKEGNALLLAEQSQVAAEHYAKAIELYEGLLNQGAENGIELGRAWRRRGDALLALGKFDAAAKAFDTAAKIFAQAAPKDADTELSRIASLKGRGEALLGLGKSDDATREFDRAAALIGNLNHQQSARLHAKILHGRGNARAGSGKTEEALADFEAAQRILNTQLESDLEGQLVLARTINNRGVLQRAAGKLNAAASDFEGATKKLAASEIAAASASAKSGSDPGIEADITLLLSDSGADSLTTERLSGQAIRKDRATLMALAQRNLAYTLMAGKRTDLAVQAFERSTSIFSELVDQQRATNLVQQYLKTIIPTAWLYATSEDPVRDGRKAREFAWRACVVSEWKFPFALEALAAASAELGDYKQAVKWQEKAIELGTAKSANEGRARLALYQSGKPFRLGAAAKK